MSRRALGGLMLAVLVAGLLWSAFAWWRAWSAPLVTLVFRPAFSVEGIATVTPVRVNGVTVGQVKQHVQDKLAIPLVTAAQMM